MTVETATYINGLNSSLPASGDDLSEGPDHFWVIKSTIKASFPGIAGAMTISHTDLNALPAAVSGNTADIAVLEGTSGAAEKLNRGSVLGGIVTATATPGSTTWTGSAGVSAVRAAGTGDYTLSLPAPFDDNQAWVVTAQVFSTGDFAYTTSERARSNGSVTIRVESGGGDNTDFNFQVIIYKY